MLHSLTNTLYSLDKKTNVRCFVKLVFMDIALDYFILELKGFLLLQQCKCEDFFLLFVFCDSKLNIFG